MRKKAVDDGTGSWAHDKFGVEEPDDDDFLSRVGEVRFKHTCSHWGSPPHNRPAVISFETEEDC